MFHLVYYAKSVNVSSCLEGVPFEVLLKSWITVPVVLCTHSGSLVLDYF